MVGGLGGGERESEFQWYPAEIHKKKYSPG